MLVVIKVPGVVGSVAIMGGSETVEVDVISPAIVVVRGAVSGVRNERYYQHTFLYDIVKDTY